MRRTGSKLSLLIALACAVSVSSGGPRDASEEPYAVIAGTVFRDDGFSLAGAEVSIHPDPSAKPKPKIKIRRMSANGRGEFAFRVPPGPMKYSVRAKAPRFQEDEKELSIAADERVDVFFTLKPLAGK